MREYKNNCLFLDGNALVVTANTTTYLPIFKKCFIIFPLITKVMTAHCKRKTKKYGLTSNFSFRSNWVVILVCNSKFVSNDMPTNLFLSSWSYHLLNFVTYF